jgi:hypothetical protein
MLGFYLYMTLLESIFLSIFWCFNVYMKVLKWVHELVFSKVEGLNLLYDNEYFGNHIR